VLSVDVRNPIFLLSKLEAVGIRTEPTLDPSHRLQHTGIKKMAQIDSAGN
jgi:hypothetical protein